MGEYYGKDKEKCNKLQAIRQIKKIIRNLIQR